MNSTRSIFAVALLIGLTACASTPKLTPKQIGESLKSSKVTVAPITNPIRLSEKTKGQAVGGFVTASVAGTVLGGGSMEASKTFAQTTGQMYGDSVKVVSGAGVDLALAKKFADHFNHFPAPAEVAPHNYVLTVQANMWQLGYVSFLTSQDYALTYQFRLRLDENIDGKLNQIATIDCGDVNQYDNSRQMPYQTWVADKYKELDAEAEKIVTQCYQNGLKNLGLI